MEIVLSSEEQALLAEVLEERRDAFLREISRTDNRDFKKLLRAKEQLLEGLLSRVRTKSAVASQIAA